MKTISTRTPEGYPTHCPLCGADTNLEFSEPTGDAPCPNCGHLLWHSANLLSSFQRLAAVQLGVARERITRETSLLDLGADSLDVVELVMEIEEEFDINIPDDADEQKTVADAVRFIIEQLGEADD